MLRGLLWSGEIEYFFDFGGSASISGDSTGFAYSYGGSLATYYCPNYIDFVEGMHLLGTRGKGPSDPSELTYIEFVSTPLGLSWSGSDGSWSSDAKVRFDIDLYQENTGQTRLVIRSIKIINGSTTLHTFTGISDINSTIPGPFGIPIIGVPPLFNTQPFVGPKPVTGADYTTSWSIDYSCTTTGGWQVKPRGAGGYSAPSIEFGDLLSGVVGPTGSSTNSVSLTCNQNFVGGHDSSSDIEDCSCWIWPNSSKEIIKSTTDVTGSNYEAVWFQWAFPQTQDFTYTAVGTPFDLAPPGDPPTWVETRTINTVHEAKSQFLERATNTSHSIEDNLLFNPYPPFTQVKSHYDWAGNLMSTNQDSILREYPYDCSGSGCASYVYGHDNFFVKYFGTWFNPFWSVGLWYPSDDADDSVRWNVNGSPAGIDDYWLPIGQQYVYHPALPSGDNTKHRVNVITETLSQNGLRDACNSWIGVPCFLGISRPEIYSETLTSTISTNSTSHFTFSGSGTVDSHINILSGTDVEMDWISYDYHPFGLPAICDSITVGWNTSNISNCKVYVVGVDGTQKLVTDNVQGTFTIPSSTSSKWASSMGHDFGAAEMSDTYSNGASSDYTGTVISTQSTHTFEMLPARAPHKLKFVVTRIDTGAAGVINHITFNKAGDNKTFHSTRRHGETLYKNGPGLRYLPGGFFNWLTDSIVSEFQPESSIELAATVGDALTFANWCWRGKDAQDNLDTILAKYFVEDEEWAVAKDAWREPDGYGLVSHSFTTMTSGGLPALWMVNSYREVPPLCAFPMQKRTFEEDWSKTDDVGYYVYTFINSKHPLITPGDTRLQLIKTSDISSLTTSVSGWSVSEYNLSTNNDEGYDYSLKLNGKQWLKMRPWRGNYNIFGDGGGNVHLTRMDGVGLMVATIVNSSGVDIFTFNQGNFSKKVTGIELAGVVSAQSAIHPSGYIVTAYENVSGNTIVTTSTNLGESFY